MDRSVLVGLGGLNQTDVSQRWWSLDPRWRNSKVHSGSSASVEWRRRSEWQNTDECGQMSPTPGLGLVYPLLECCSGSEISSHSHHHLKACPPSPPVSAEIYPGPHLFTKKFQSQIQNQLLILLSLFLVSLMLSFSVIKCQPLLET